GSSGLDNIPQLAQFELRGQRPPHNDDQRGMYGDLVYGTPIGPAGLSRFYKDATFGVKPEDVERVEHPRSDVTIVRDKLGVPPGYEQESDRLRADAEAYTAGINQYIAEARLDPMKMPAEYAAIGRPQGPEDWKVSDTVAAVTLVGAIFGNGGGRELLSALILEDAQARFGQ